jgi:hypothetical protein
MSSIRSLPNPLLIEWSRTSLIDEGMTHGSSILAYLVFGPGRTSTKVMARPTKMAA